MLDLETRVTNLENSVNQLLILVNDLVGKMDNPTKEQPKQQQPQQQNQKKVLDKQQIKSQEDYHEAKTLFIEKMNDREFRTIDEIRELTGISGKKIKRIIKNLMKKDVIRIDEDGDEKKYRYDDIPF